MSKIASSVTDGQSMLVRVPSASTTTWSTASCGTYAAVQTPNGVPAAGGRVMANPGYDASVSSPTAPEKARPTGSGEELRTWQRSRAVAGAWVSGSSQSARSSCHSTLSSGKAASACPTWSLTSSALASISSPVSSSSTLLR
ncbi:MAG: hypothetical protein WKF83_02145 [Nocardioidaceae bacterium]